jgi:hypothetical protein
MDGGRGGARSVARGALAAAVIMGALALTAGPAMANDRSTEVICIDRATGAWRASMTFSSIDVHDGHPVVVSFGSDTVTLTAPGADGSATLSQDAGGDEDSATWSWSIARNGVVERAGSDTFSRPGGCESTPATVPPPTQPPSTAPPPTPPPATMPPATAPPAGPRPPGPGRPAAPVPSPAPLPTTGTPMLPLGAAAVVIVGLGALARRWAARRSDQLIGD